MAVRRGIYAVIVIITGTPGGSNASASEIQRLPTVTIKSSSATPSKISDRRETLEQAWATALAADQGLEAKRWDVSSAAQSLHLARAQRWPIIVADSSYTARDNEQAFKLHSPGSPFSTYIVPIVQDEDFAFRTEVSLPLYTSGRTKHGIAAAEAKVSAAELEVTSSRSNLKMRVAEEYVAVLRAQRELEVARSSMKSLQAHARDVELLFAHGQVPRNDLLAAGVALSNARQRMIQAGNLLDTSRAAYNRRLGRPLAAEVHLAELLVETEVESVESLTARALRARPEIASLGKQSQALRHQAAGLRAANGPQVELLGEYAFGENRFRTPEGITSVGVGVHWNVFDGGRNRHQVLAVLRRAESLMRVKADVESLIKLQVRRAWLDVQETQRRIAVTREALEQAEENLRVARKRYAAGLGTNTEVLDAETLRTRTYRNHDNATYEVVLAMLRLRHATGELRR